MLPKEKKRPWLTALKYTGITFAALIILPCFCFRSPPAPLEGYVPAEVYRWKDEKKFSALAKVRAYKHYEEDIATFGPRSGEWTVDRFSGYRFDVSAIVLRNGKTHPLVFESEETPYNYEFQATTEDSEWFITLIPATQDNIKEHKPTIGKWPILFVQ